jgi:hypothetical protein
MLAVLGEEARATRRSSSPPSLSLSDGSAQVFVRLLECVSKLLGPTKTARPSGIKEFLFRRTETKRFCASLFERVVHA